MEDLAVCISCEEGPLKRWHGWDVLWLGRRRTMFEKLPSDSRRLVMSFLALKDLGQYCGTSASSWHCRRWQERQRVIERVLEQRGFLSNDLLANVDAVYTFVVVHGTTVTWWSKEELWHSEILSVVDEDIRDNGEIVNLVTKSNPEQLQYASERLLDTEDVVYHAIASNFGYDEDDFLQFASQRLRENRAFNLRLVRDARTAYVYRYMTTHFKRDAFIIAEACKQYIKNLAYIPADLRRVPRLRMW